MDEAVHVAGSVDHEARIALRRIRVIAAYTLGEAIRLKLFILLGLAGAGLVATAQTVSEFNFAGAELKFIGDLGLGAISVFGTLLAVLVTAHLFFTEISSGTICCVLTRSVRHWEYVWGKFSGVAALLVLFVTGLGMLLAALLHFRGLQLGVAPVAFRVLVGACAVVWLKVSLVAAVTLLVCSYARSALFASCVSLLVTAAGLMAPLVHGQARWAWLRLWPNLARFDAETLLASGQLPGAGVCLNLLVYWSVYVALFGLLASHVLRYREF